eukprot:scaffold17422_cov103-Cylindrotheca_fusiformis.AAC.5
MNTNRPIGGAEGSTVGLVIMNVKKFGADDGPNGRRVRATLASTIDRKVFSVLVERLRDPQGSLHAKLGLFEQGGMHLGGARVEPMEPAQQGFSAQIKIP